MKKRALLFSLIILIGLCLPSSYGKRTKRTPIRLSKQRRALIKRFVTDDQIKKPEIEKYPENIVLKRVEKTKPVKKTRAKKIVQAPYRTSTTAQEDAERIREHSQLLADKASLERTLWTIRLHGINPEKEIAVQDELEMNVKLDDVGEKEAFTIQEIIEQIEKQQTELDAKLAAFRTDQAETDIRREIDNLNFREDQLRSLSNEIPEITKRFSEQIDDLEQERREFIATLKEGDEKYHKGYFDLIDTQKKELQELIDHYTNQRKQLVLHINRKLNKEKLTLQEKIATPSPEKTPQEKDEEIIIEVEKVGLEKARAEFERLTQELDAVRRERKRTIWELRLYVHDPLQKEKAQAAREKLVRLIEKEQELEKKRVASPLAVHETNLRYQETKKRIKSLESVLKSAQRARSTTEDDRDLAKEKLGRVKAFKKEIIAKKGQDIYNKQVQQRERKVKAYTQLLEHYKTHEKRLQELLASLESEQQHRQKILTEHTERKLAETPSRDELQEKIDEHALKIESANWYLLIHGPNPKMKKNLDERKNQGKQNEMWIQVYLQKQEQEKSPAEKAAQKETLKQELEYLEKILAEARAADRKLLQERNKATSEKLSAKVQIQNFGPHERYLQKLDVAVENEQTIDAARKNYQTNIAALESEIEELKASQDRKTTNADSKKQKKLAGAGLLGAGLIGLGALGTAATSVTAGSIGLGLGAAALTTNVFDNLKEQISEALGTEVQTAEILEEEPEATEDYDTTNADTTQSESNE